MSPISLRMYAPRVGPMPVMVVIGVSKVIHDLSDFAVHFLNLLFQKIEVFCIEPDHRAENVAGHGETEGTVRKRLKLLRFRHAETLVAGDFDEMTKLLKTHLG